MRAGMLNCRKVFSCGIIQIADSFKSKTKNMNEALITVGVVSLIAAFIVWSVLKRWNSAWEGILKDKIIKEQRDSGVDEDDYSSGTSRSFVLIFETAEGKKIKQKVSRKKFEEAVVGDKFVKTKKSWSANKI